jgi:hypothetical protein
LDLAAVDLPAIRAAIARAEARGDEFAAAELRRPYEGLGHIIAVAQLVDDHLAVDGQPTCCAPWGQRWYAPGKPAYHLVLDNVIGLPRPVACSGALGLWITPVNVLASVMNQLQALPANFDALVERMAGDLADPRLGAANVATVSSAEVLHE